MTLTIEQLEAIADRYRRLHLTRDVWPEEQGLRAEIKRRKHGPFTIAEAIASGRPFSSKSTGIVYCIREDEFGSKHFYEKIPHGDWTPTYGPSVAEMLLTDYELAEGGD